MGLLSVIGLVVWYINSSPGATLEMMNTPMDVMKKNPKAMRKYWFREPMRVETRDTTMMRVTEMRMAAYASVHFLKFSTPRSYSLA